MPSLPRYLGDINTHGPPLKLDFHYITQSKLIVLFSSYMYLEDYKYLSRDGIESIDIDSAP